MSRLALALRMLLVALRYGASIPRALQAVGGAMAGPLGEGLAQAGEALQRGSFWHEAWVVQCDDERLGESFRVISTALEPSWTHGSAPGVRLQTAIEQLMQRRRSEIERNASNLSVKLLLPTGLCFLPAFIAIGVVPAIIAFAI